MSANLILDKDRDFTEIPIHSWQQLYELYQDFFDLSQKSPKSNFPLGRPYWIYHSHKPGSPAERKPLLSRLEEDFELYGIADNEKPSREKFIIDEFQRKASLYIHPEPEQDDILEWLALMRHHGAPTRLMDWTYSFFIAVYFAIAENLVGEIWALDAAEKLNTQTMIDRLYKAGSKYKQHFDELFQVLQQHNKMLESLRKIGKLKDIAIVCCLMDNPLNIVYALNPFRLNKRLTIQQGLFMLSGDITKPFELNLKQTFMDHSAKNMKDCLYRITLDFSQNKPERNNILRQLRQMNINNAVLFPDLDGFAKSMHETLAYPVGS